MTTRGGTNRVAGTRVHRGKIAVTSKVLIATAVTIHRLGCHTGEEWQNVKTL
jgi:hypothetical protein